MTESTRTAHRLARALTVAAAIWGVISAILGVALWRFIRERYTRGGPMPPSQAFMLLNPQRTHMHPVDEVLRAFRVREGDTVLELGPGPGYFSAGASRAVGPRGHVVCVDLQPGMIRILADRLRAEHITNAQPVAGDAVRLPLADHRVDTAFLMTVLGEIPDRPGALRELLRVLKPGGTLSIGESLGDPDYQLEASVRDLCAAIGFTAPEVTRLRLGYALSFRAPGLA
jgi:ubiquinone/menaquinone biosynthesis C-methylase UbiE